MQDPLSTALAPEEALRQWCDPDAVKAMDQLSYYAERAPITILGGPPTHDEIMHDRYCHARAPLEAFLIGQLVAGQWAATAFQLPLTLQSKRMRVPPQFWRFLQLDFKAATAEGNEMKLVEIQIERSPFHSVHDPTSPALEGPTSESSMRHSSSDGMQVQLQLSGDDSILTLFGEKLIFGGPIQRSILRQLVDAHRDDRRLRTAEVLRRAGSEVDSIAKAFRSNRHWPKLTQIIRQEQGFIWLDLRTPP
jgi:hypothetical protein